MGGGSAKFGGAKWRDAGGTAENVRHRSTDCVCSEKRSDRKRSEGGTAGADRGSVSPSEDGFGAAKRAEAMTNSLWLNIEQFGV